jgi:uncharacterized RmlC-like cupin family protein
MRVIRPGAEHEVPRGVVAGTEISRRTTGADSNLFMGVFRLPPGARSRPHFHAHCESGCLMLSGGMRIRWGERLEHEVVLQAGDMLYVPPHETHVLENLSPDAPAEYCVARNSPDEDAVEVPWAT